MGAARRRLTRRQLLAGAGGGLVALGLGGLAGYEWPHGGSDAGSASGVDDPAQVMRFVSRPDLFPPSVRVTLSSDGRRFSPPAASPRYIFVSPRHDSTAPSQQGLMILDREGQLIWFMPLLGKNPDPFDFNAQAYRGRPVLTWWRGEVISGHGVGIDEMADSSYSSRGSIQAGDGLMADLHELNLTSAGTALITAYAETSADLSVLGRSPRAKVFAGHAQEIDIATGKVLLDWDSLAHVGVEESYLAPPTDDQTPYDYFHINSVSETPDGNLLISGRNTWALYKVDRSSGKVIWRLNGKRSDFQMGAGSRFYWQHDSRVEGESTLTVFDDGGTPAEERHSRALLLSVDLTARKVSLTRAYLNPAGFLAANQGSVQLLPDGRVFVGWGNQPYFSEFAPDGTLLLDGQFPIGVRSYRAFAQDWKGSPAEPPRLAVRPNPSGGSVVYTSWNGSTATRGWRVLSGNERSSLSPTGTQEWAGFETAIAVPATDRYFCTVALDADGRELRRSEILRRPD